MEAPVMIEGPTAGSSSDVNVSVVTCVYCGSGEFTTYLYRRLRL